MNNIIKQSNNYLANRLPKSVQNRVMIIKGLVDHGLNRTRGEYYDLWEL